MDIDNDYNFKYFMDYIIKRLSGLEDAHTKFVLTSPIPINFRIFDNDVIINYPYKLKGSKLLSINNISIDKVILELEEVITYGTSGKRKYEIENDLFNRFVLFGLPSFRNCNELDFKILKLDGDILEIKYNKDKDYTKDMFSMSKYRYGNNCSYKFIDNCLVYNHRSLQPGFEKMIINAMNNLRKENLDNIDTIIIDLRGNTGGNSALN